MYLHIARFIHLHQKKIKRVQLLSLRVYAVNSMSDLIAIGNGTASRETEAVVAEMMAATTAT